jgi:hypothetical protein
VAGSPGAARQLASSWRTPSAATASTRACDADANSRSATATGVTNSSSEASKPRSARRSARAAGGIESVLVVKRTVRPWSRSHRTASEAPGTTRLPTYRVPSRSSSTVSIPVSRPTPHLHHARLEPPQGQGYRSTVARSPAGAGAGRYVGSAGSSRHGWSGSPRGACGIDDRPAQGRDRCGISRSAVGEAVGGGQEAALVGLQQQLVGQHLVGDRNRRGRLNTVARPARVDPHDPTS